MMYNDDILTIFQFLKNPINSLSYACFTQNAGPCKDLNQKMRLSHLRMLSFEEHLEVAKGTNFLQSVSLQYSLACKLEYSRIKLPSCFHQNIDLISF